MVRLQRYIISLLLITGIAALILQVTDSKGRSVKLRYSKPVNNALNNFALPKDTPNPTTNLHYPIKQQDPQFNGPPSNHPLYLHNPSNINDSVYYDYDNNEYIFNNKIGDIDNGAPNTMTFKEYQDYDMDKALRSYWHERTKAAGVGNRGGLIPQIKIGGEVFDKIFGSNVIDIRPQGSAELIFGVIGNNRQDPSLNIKQRSTLNFDFQEKIQMSVIAKIGDKIEFKTNYNTESMFAFENKLKLKYEGKEDEILQLIEAGDVNLPLNSTLIQGSQSLFGIKTKLKFGRTTVTGVFSEQKSESKNITVQGGAETSKFKFKADQYEENKHFFLAQYFRNNYNSALSSLPIISSNINITKIEVWRTNIGAPTTNNRNVVALTDLGESAPTNSLHVTPITSCYGFPLPSNYINSLKVYLDTASGVHSLRDINTVSNTLQSAGFNSGQDYEKVESAKKLAPNEFTFNARLGFISLNQALNPDQVLAVAFQYTKIGDTAVYQVGEFSDQGINDPKTLVVKLLKSSTLNTTSPLWKLMMKNVYSLGAYQVNRQDFRLNILYAGDQNGVLTGYFTEGPKKGIALIRLLHLDTLDAQMNPNPDGVFDFIDNAATQGGTIQASNGRIFFPLVEPFGKDLANILGDPAYAQKYCFDSLYTLTRTQAQQYPEKDKYYFEGIYKSTSGSEISLGGFNIPQGSVKVTAGGMPLTENVDYTVDYTLGRVKIINEGILNSGQPINISLESNSMFNIMTKRLMAAHVNYEINKDFNIGGTIMNLHQSPLTQKVNYGDEPISNTIWGMDVSYQTESRLLTKLVDALPFIQTKAVSKVNFYGEFAQFIPGHSSAIGATGTSYIDDFEGSLSAIDLKNVGSWFLASTPQGQTQYGLFPEAAPNTGLKYGFNRAKLAWYVIDPLFYDASSKPPNVTTYDQSTPSAREVFETEVFPNKELANGTPSNIAIMNLAYYPTERGPYNYDVNGEGGFSYGLNADGTLKNPDTRWAGIMRKLETTDFEATNVEYIQFWMMDPFINMDGQNGHPLHSGGQLYFNLGDISEDLLRDSRKLYENGLPTSAVVANVDTTIWGRVPKLQALVNAFDNDPNARPYQDVGYDGLKNSDEVSFFDTAYIQKVATYIGPATLAHTKALADPSADDYHYFRGGDYDSYLHDITARYKNFSNPDGNSPAGNGPEAYPTMATTMPNVEDINYDNTLSESENYYQYVIDLKPAKMVIGQNYITDIQTSNGIRLPNGNTVSTKWYQFKIPVRSPDKVVGNITNFQSIRFMRMFLKGFKDSIFCRFATLQLIRGEWRKYGNSLLYNGDYVPTDQSGTSFNIAAVNIEENGSRSPIPYVMPPGIARQVNQATTNLAKLNEQALSMKIINLIDGDARAIYKTTDFDFRQYKRLQMFTHAEKVSEDLKYGDVTVFVRLGSDFTENYYEYELPLNVTPWGTGASADNLIWPEANNVDIDLLKIVAIKENRNILIRSGNTTVAYNKPYVEHDGNAKITVVGTPNLGSVKTIMIGVRNPKKQTLADHDDMLPKSAEVWVNELRLTDFLDKTGYAATARVRANLADLGDVASSISYSSAGFGSIEQKVNETQKDNITNFDVATNIELSKFLPPKTGLKIPMHYDYSSSVSNPKYNPLDPDVQLADDLATYPTTAQQDSIKQLVQDYTTRKNLNFMNVRKERVGASLAKPKFYDVENLDVSYSYAEIYHRNVDIEYDIKKTYRGGLGYNFVNNPKSVRPFAKIGFISKYSIFSLLKEFNFYYTPKLMSFRTEMLREYEENKLRNKSTGLIILEPTYFKTFNWNRIYSLKFDLATSLTMEYSATASAIIDEPQGQIDTKQKRDSIWHNVLDFGRMNHFNQTTNINYNIPINKIPLLNWISSTAKYGSDYKWDASPLSLKRLGNTVENSNTKQLNGNVNMTTLFEKVPYIKKLNQKSKVGKMSMTPPRGKGVRDDNNTEKPPEEASDTIKKPKESAFKKITDQILRIITGVKTASISYTENQGMTLPGFIPEPSAIGNNWNQNAPGLPFVFGSQQDIRLNAVRNHWLTTDTLMNNQFLTKYSNTVNARVDFEPLNDMKIEIIANRTYTENHSEFFKADATGTFPDLKHPINPVNTGSFSISFLSFATAFTSNNADNSNKTFTAFLNNRGVIAARLAKANPHWNGTYQMDTATQQNFPTGYGATSQDVLIPAFLAAYAGKDPGGVSLSAFPLIPLPNWTITYTGLSKIKKFKKYVKTITISNSYRSTYAVGAYTTNILYTSTDGYQTVRNTVGYGNYLPARQIDQVTISEQFAPLIKIEISWQNSLMTNIEIKKSRNISLSFTNNQLTELTSNEFIIGLGYRIKDVQLNIVSQGGKTKKIKSDINLKCDFSIRTNETILRRVDENVNQISQGQQVISINTSADYMISERFKIRAFFDKVINNPFISSSFPQSTTNAGLSITFSLAQ